MTEPAPEVLERAVTKLDRAAVAAVTAWCWPASLSVECGADILHVMTHDPVVYLVQLNDLDHVKIGFSTNLDSRLRSLRTVAISVVPLLVIGEASRALEKEIHWLLRGSRITREIFRFDDRVQNFIESCNQEGVKITLKELHKRDKELLRAITGPQQPTETQKDAYFASLVAERKRRTGR